MLSYPKKDMSDLMNRFCSEESCRIYIEQLRWPEGYKCSRCGCDKHWKTKRGLNVCSKCQYQQSPLVGTIFQDTHIPLRIWFQAIWWFTSQKSGASAQSLQRVLGLKGHEPAWLMLHKLRIAMIRPDRDQLTGEVEVDEGYFGGTGNKHLVGVAAEVRGSRIGRIRMQTIRDRSGLVLQSFVKQHITAGATIVTDGLKSYCGVEKEGYSHKPLRKPYFWEDQNPEDDRLLPRVHKVISLAKGWVFGTYQGSVDPRYFDSYLNEFVFRFNRRTSRSRGLLFHRLLENAVAVGSVPQKRIKAQSNL